MPSVAFCVRTNPSLPLHPSCPPEPIYLTFLDVQEFNDTCLELLKSMPSAIMQLNLTQTPQLSRDFVKLLTLYVQLHVFWSFVEERKVLLALYSCAYQCVHGRTEKVSSIRRSPPPLAKHTHKRCTKTNANTKKLNTFRTMPL